MDEIQDRLAKARADAGYANPTEAARAFGWVTSTYLGYENGDRNPSRERAKQIGKAFKVRWEWILEGTGPMRVHQDTKEPDLNNRTVEVTGIAGAGPNGEIVFGGDQGSLGRVPAPVTWTTTTSALEIRGSSMRPMAFDGWVAYYDADKTMITEDMYGEPCVVWLKDGRCLIKIPQPGKKPGTFDLESANPYFETMRDIEVEAASLVTSFIPRRAAKRIMSDVVGDVGT